LSWLNPGWVDVSLYAEVQCWWIDPSVAWIRSHCALCCAYSWFCRGLTLQATQALQKVKCWKKPPTCAHYRKTVVLQVGFRRLGEGWGGLGLDLTLESAEASVKYQGRVGDLLQAGSPRHASRKAKLVFHAVIWNSKFRSTQIRSNMLWLKIRLQHQPRMQVPVGVRTQNSPTLPSKSVPLHRSTSWHGLSTFPQSRGSLRRRILQILYDLESQGKFEPMILIEGSEQDCTSGAVISRGNRNQVYQRGGSPSWHSLLWTWWLCSQTYVMAMTKLHRYVTPPFILLFTLKAPTLDLVNSLVLLPRGTDGITDLWSQCTQIFPPSPHPHLTFLPTFTCPISLQLPPMPRLLTHSKMVWTRPPLSAEGRTTSWSPLKSIFLDRLAGAVYRSGYWISRQLINFGVAT